jgi:hypothetical protein
MSSFFSDDPADLFVQLYDLLGNECFQDGRAERWGRDPGVRSRAVDIERLILATGRAPTEGLDELLSSQDKEGAFTVLLALDLALAHINPFSGWWDPGRLYEVETRYARTARLNTDGVSGALLFGCAYAGRPQGQPEKRQFFELVRVEPAVWREVNLGWLESCSDFVIGSVGGPGQPRTAVGCAPMISSLNDLSITAVKRYDDRGYRIAPRAQVLRERVHEMLTALDESGAVIGVVPESTLSDDMLDEWRAAIQRRRQKTSLRWIVAGTGPVGDADPPNNRAVVLDRRSGKELVAQDKRHDFTLTTEQIRLWGLEPHLGSGRAIEDITRGTHLELRESNIGRLAILICEDAGRTATVAPLLLECGVSHVFVPIFSAPFAGPYGWIQGPAREYVSSVGATVVVANGLAVYSAMAEGTAADENERDAALTGATCYAIGPSATRDDWHIDRVGLRSSGPLDVKLLDITLGRAHRYDDWD